MDNQAFFLPIETRPKNLPPWQKMAGRFWHTGLIHNGKVYECFNFGRKSVRNFDETRKRELIDQKAVFVNMVPDIDKIHSEINSGTDCSEYVARVVGMSSNTGNKKEYWPEEVYNFILLRNQYEKGV